MMNNPQPEQTPATSPVGTAAGDVQPTAPSNSLHTQPSSLVFNALLALGLALVAIAGFGTSLGWFDALWRNPIQSTAELSELADATGVSLSDPASSADSTPASSGARAVAGGSQIPSQTAQATPPPLDPVLAADSPAILAEGRRVAEHLRRAMPSSLDALEMQARFEFEFGSVEKAKAIWKQLLEQQSGYVYALVGLGNAASLEGALDEAVNYHRRGVLADPNNLGQQLTLGIALIAAGDLEEAKLVLQAVIAKNDKLVDAVIELATVELQLGDVQAARKSFESALQLDPNNARVHQGLVSVFGRLKDNESMQRHQAEHVRLRELTNQERQTGRDAYDDVAALRVDVGKFYNDMGRVYVAGNNLKAGELLLLRASRMNPDDIDSRQALAWLAASQGRPFESIRWLSEISELRPSEFTYAREIARLYAQVDQIDETLATLEEFLSLNPQSAEAHRALTNYYLDAAPDSDQAIKHALETTRLSATADSFALLAAVYQEGGKITEAIGALERALALDPNNTQLRQMLALMRSPLVAPSPAENKKE